MICVSASPLRAGLGWRAAAFGAALPAGWLLICLLAAGAKADGVARFTVSGDAVERPLDGAVGDAVRGRAIVRDRAVGNCLACHQIAAERDEPQQGNVGPPLDGVGQRLRAGQLRLRLIDQSQLNPRTLMPPYHRVDGLVAVPQAQRGRPMLDARQIEDVIAYLQTL